MKKTLIFVDGQNLFYSLKDMHLQEVQIKWDLFFSGLLEADDELIRVYWYQPQKLAEQRITFEKAYRIVEVQAPGKNPDEIKAEASALVAKANEWLEENHKKYQKQLHRYDEMSIEYPVIEMVRKGVVKIDPLRQSYIGEKGVDVAIAVSMIKFHEKCDKLILVSGDLDYAEAIQFIKDNLKKVYLVRLFKGHPPVNKSVSRTLMALADKVVDLYESEIRRTYVK